jgi:hypothetical protein
MDKQTDRILEEMWHAARKAPERRDRYLFLLSLSRMAKRGKIVLIPQGDDPWQALVVPIAGARTAEDLFIHRDELLDDDPLDGETMDKMTACLLIEMSQAIQIARNRELLDRFSFLLDLTDMALKGKIRLVPQGDDPWQALVVPAVGQGEEGGLTAEDLFIHRDEPQVSQWINNLLDR